MHASSVTRPSLSGRPPYPTLRSVGSPSGIFTPASTASRARPLFFRISHAAPFALTPKFQVERTIGLFTFPSENGTSSSLDLNEFKAIATEPIAAVFIKSLRFAILLFFYSTPISSTNNQASEPAPGLPSCILPKLVAITFMN